MKSYFLANVWPHGNRVSHGAAAVCIVLSIMCAWAEETLIDFDTMPPGLPGWTASTVVGGQSSSQPATKWQSPFQLMLDGENPHSGSHSLKWEFTEQSEGTFNFGPATFTASGNADIRFFVRTAGINDTNGVVCLDEFDQDNKRIKGNWAVAKIPLSNEWTEVSWTTPLDSRTSSIRLRFFYRASAMETGAKLWLDDISIRSAKQ